MDRPAANTNQADCVLHLITQICKRTNLQMDIYQRAMAAAEAEGRPEQVRDLRRFLGMQLQDRKLLCELVNRTLSTGVPAGRPSVRAEGSRGWHCRWLACRRSSRLRPRSERIILHRSDFRKHMR